MVQIRGVCVGVKEFVIRVNVSAENMRRRPEIRYQFSEVWLRVPNECVAMCRRCVVKPKLGNLGVVNLK